MGTSEHYPHAIPFSNMTAAAKLAFFLHVLPMPATSYMSTLGQPRSRVHKEVYLPGIIIRPSLRMENKESERPRRILHCSTPTVNWLRRLRRLLAPVLTFGTCSACNVANTRNKLYQIYAT